MPLNNILLYTDDNIIGQSIHDYLSDIHQDITQASYQDIVQGGVAPLAETVIFNMIHKDIRRRYGRITQQTALSFLALYTVGIDGKKRYRQSVPGINRSGKPVNPDGKIFFRRIFGNYQNAG